MPTSILLSYCNTYHLYSFLNIYMHKVTLLWSALILFPILWHLVSLYGVHIPTTFTYYSADFLIIKALSHQSLFYISMLLHAIFFYVFALSTIYSIVASSFNMFYIKLFIRYLVSLLKS